MFSPVHVGVSDFERALACYRALMPVLGIAERFCEADRPWAGWQSPPGPRPLFLIGRPEDGRAHAIGNGQMVAFMAGDRAGASGRARFALDIAHRPPGWCGGGQGAFDGAEQVGTVAREYADT